MFVSGATVTVGRIDHRTSRVRSVTQIDPAEWFERVHGHHQLFSPTKSTGDPCFGVFWAESLKRFLMAGKNNFDPLFKNR